MNTVSASGRIRLRIHIEGNRPEDVRFYAAYLDVAAARSIR